MFTIHYRRNGGRRVEVKEFAGLAFYRTWLAQMPDDDFIVVVRWIA